MLEVWMVIVMTSLACGILGPFLVFQKAAMVADALSHSVLLGIVLAFLWIRDVRSPILLLGAALFGLLTVQFVERLKLQQIQREEALGLVSALFFSIAVMIISRYFRNAHLDVDIVLMGNPLFSPFIRWGIFPKAFVQMALLFGINLAFVVRNFEALKLSCFDADYARLQGIKIKNLFYGLMVLTSLTTVASFDSVGAILVISLFVTASVTACFITKDFKWTLICSLLIGVWNSTIGFLVANYYNVSVAGMCSFISFLTCLAVLLFHKGGFIRKKMYFYEQKRMVEIHLLLIHLWNHPCQKKEVGFESLHEHLNWSKEQLDKRIQFCLKNDWVVKNNQEKVYQLSPIGQKRVKLLLGKHYDKQQRRLFTNDFSNFGSERGSNQ